MAKQPFKSPKQPFKTHNTGNPVSPGNPLILSLSASEVGGVMFQCSRLVARFAVPVAAVTGLSAWASWKDPTACDSGIAGDSNKVPIRDCVIVSGTSSPSLATDVANISNIPLSNVEVKRFSDGEISCRYKESVRGLNVYIIQSCSSPVNDNIMELLLLVSAAKRAGANRVTAVIPYFGYKYHRRGAPISTMHNSRFLWSVSADLAAMLQTVGVDSVISVDLQRPGQGHEACFFDSEVPIENISSNDILANYFTEEVRLEGPVVVVAPNSDHVKKAIKFKQKLAAKGCYERIDHAIFLPSKEGNNTVLQASGAEFLGDVKGADVIIVDDICETGGTLSVLCRRLIKEGAKRVYFCASHGLFTSTSMEMIELSPVEQVVVTIPFHYLPQMM